MNPGEHRNSEPEGSGKSLLPVELAAQGSVTTPRQRGEFISQAGGGTELPALREGVKDHKGRHSRKRKANLSEVNTL
jgi:hypothetical protein